MDFLSLIFSEWLQLRRVAAQASKYAVFFARGPPFGIEMVQALDAVHAQDIARAQHPTGRLLAVSAELLDGLDRHKILRCGLGGRGDGTRGMKPSPEISGCSSGATDASARRLVAIQVMST